MLFPINFPLCMSVSLWHQLLRTKIGTSLQLLNRKFSNRKSSSVQEMEWPHSLTVLPSIARAVSPPPGPSCALYRVRLQISYANFFHPNYEIFFNVIFFKFVSLSLLCKWLKKTSFENTSCFSWIILKISYFFI